MNRDVENHAALFAIVLSMVPSRGRTRVADMVAWHRDVTASTVPDVEASFGNILELLDRAGCVVRVDDEFSRTPLGDRAIATWLRMAGDEGKAAAAIVALAQGAGPGAGHDRQAGAN